MNIQDFRTSYEQAKKIDCIISIGLTCRPAMNIQYNGLRFFSSPIDFMEVQSINVVFKLFENKFDDFFNDYKVDYNKVGANGMLWVDDIKNNTYSIHHFRKDIPIEESHRLFKETVSRRAHKMDSILRASKNIVIASERNETTEELLYFTKRFLELYPNLHIELINIRNDTSMTFSEINQELIYHDDKISHIEYFFNDTRNGLDVPEGNIAMWSAILLKYENNNLMNLKKEWIKIRDKCENIILYGVDRKLARVVNWLSNIGIRIEGTISSLNETLDKNTCFIICIDDKKLNNEYNLDSIKNELHKNGYKNVLVCNDFLNVIGSNQNCPIIH